MKNIKKPLKIIFAGTPSFSAYYLKKIISEKHTVLGVLTQPDRPNSRGKIIIQSPVKKLAQKYHIPVFQPNKINNYNDCAKILTIKADIMIVAAYGLILPKYLLHGFPMGCINIHASLLPHWRGASPIQWSILSGEKKTGITIIKMNDKLDAGEILHQVPCKIFPKDTTQSLLRRLCQVSSKELLNTLINIQNKKIIPKKQNEKEATYATKLKKSMGKIIFSKTAKYIERMIRAFYPWPGTYIEINDIKIKIHQAEVLISNQKNKIGKIININNDGIQIQTKKNILNVQKIQIPGKNIISIKQFIQTKNKIFTINQIIKNNNINMI